MAEFNVHGLDDLCADLENISALPPSIKSEMLTAAGEEVVRATRDQTPVDTGLTKSSIKAQKPVISRDGGSVTIAPSGQRTRYKTTTRNPEIAYVTEFGSRGRAANPFMQRGAEEAQAPAADAAFEVYDDYLNSIGL